jgi:hypothetical protein
MLNLLTETPKIHPNSQQTSRPTSQNELFSKENKSLKPKTIKPV